MIARKPKNKDAQAAAFIRKPENGGAGRVKRNLVPVWISADRDLLERIDEMAKVMGLNRSAFIISAVAEKLRQLEQKV